MIKSIYQNAIFLIKNSSLVFFINNDLISKIVHDLTSSTVEVIIFGSV